MLGSVVDCVSKGDARGAVRTAGSSAAKAQEYTPIGRVLRGLSNLTGRTVGLCASADYLAIIDLNANLCYYAAADGTSGYTTSSGVGAGAPWGASVLGTISVSNACSIDDLGGRSNMTQVAVGEVVVVGGSYQWITVNGKTTWVQSAGVGGGWLAPIPFGTSFSPTWTATVTAW